MSKQSHLAGISLCLLVILFSTLTFLPLASQGKKEAKAPKYMEVEVGGGVKMKLVYIEPGKFLMGSPKSDQEYVGKEFGKHAGGWASREIQHEVEITKGFWMGVFEVTQQEYEKVTGNNPSQFKGERLPVDRVSCEDALEFCKRLSKKVGKTFDLPTEAEWEYACRAGSTGPFHYGNSLSSKQANFNGDFPYGGAEKGPNLKKTAPVGSYEPNAFGLHDMHGNVWEWCKDWHEEDYYKNSPGRDPQGPAKGDMHVLRGGSWGHSALICRSAARPPTWSDFPYEGDGGFRVIVRLP